MRITTNETAIFLHIISYNEFTREKESYRKTLILLIQIGTEVPMHQLSTENYNIKYYVKITIWGDYYTK